MITGSLDHHVILWDISKSEYIFKFDHLSIVTCITFCPNVIFIIIKQNDEYFATGCIDKIIRIFSSKKRTIVDYKNVDDLITAIEYSPTSEHLVVGCHNGKCEIFKFDV